MSIINGNNLIDIIERQRLEIQHQLDSLKTQTERNKLGQFATPTVLATDILEYAKTLLPTSQQIRFLDPAFGTGAFYSALLRVFPSSRIVNGMGVFTTPPFIPPVNGWERGRWTFAGNPFGVHRRRARQCAD